MIQKNIVLGSNFLNGDLKSPESNNHAFRGWFMYVSDISFNSKTNRIKFGILLQNTDTTYNVLWISDK